MKNGFSITIPGAIIFDMDGVIIDSKELVESFWIEKFTQFNLDVPEENFEERFHGRPARLIIDQEFPSLSEAQRTVMEREIKEYDSSVEQFDLIPGIEIFLRQCKKEDIPIALVTSALPPKVNVMKKSLGFDPGFFTEVTADRVENGKPNPECYNLALREMGVAPNNAVVFEDSVSGVQAAAGSKATVIGVNEPHMHASLKQNGASNTIRNFTEAIIDSDESSLHFTST